MYFTDGRIRKIDRSVGEGLRSIFSASRLRFDDNFFSMNNVMHPVGGLLYYGIPRANGASATRSFLTLLAASAFWEQVVELQEIASINDHIATPISGYAIGEAMFQARMFFLRGERNLINRGLALVPGTPIVATELARSRAGPMRAGRMDDQGFADDVERRFRFYIGTSHREGVQWFPQGLHYEIGMESEVQNTGRRDVAGQRSGWQRATTATQFDIGFSFDEGDLNEARILAKVIPRGWYHHNVQSEDAGAKGATLLVGPAVAFELDMLGDEPSRLFMQMVGAYMLGATVDAQLLRGSMRARVVLDGFATFAQVTPIARLDNPDHIRSDEASPYRSYLYYNSLGPSTAATASVSWRRIEVRGAARHHWFTSIDKTDLDRYPEIATNIRAKHDNWATLSAGVAVRPLRNLELTVRREHRNWTGAIQDFHNGKRERAWWTQVSAAF